jgi:hypothetical protein
MNIYRAQDDQEKKEGEKKLVTLLQMLKILNLKFQQLISWLECQLLQTKTTTSNAPHSLSRTRPSQKIPSHTSCSWLCPEGPYSDVVKAMCAADPRLKQRDPKNITQGTRWPSMRKPTVIALELTSNQVFQRQATFTDAPTVATYLSSLDSSANGNARCSVYLVEGLSPEIVNVLGSHFGIHPGFFVSHERTVVFSTDPEEISDNYLPPSLVCSKKTFLLKYFEPLCFITPITNFKLSCAVTGRHIGITRLRGNFSQVGIVRLKISFWSKENSDGGWDCMLNPNLPFQGLNLIVF